METLRIESGTRWDALDLEHRLGRFDGYLVQLDEEHWQVCLQRRRASRELPAELLGCLEAWLDERELGGTVVHGTRADHVLTRD